MNRQEYFNIIEEQLDFLAFRLEMRGKLNLLEMHLHSEGFYQHLFNLVFDWNLKNINATMPNTPGIDLVDLAGKLVVQVSATATKTKVESALAKDLSAYKGFAFKFISISKCAENLRAMAFANPHGLKFFPQKDVYDVPSLLSTIASLPIGKIEAVADLVTKELRHQPDPTRIEANLTLLIKRLSEEDLRPSVFSSETIPYDVEAKIAHNNIAAAKSLIADHKVHYPRLDRIYTEFDKQGANRSLSVLGMIRSIYNAVAETISPDERFFRVVSAVLEQLTRSTPALAIPDEELRLCVEVLVVDAFIRCKIFNNPEGYENVGP